MFRAEVRHPYTPEGCKDALSLRATSYYILFTVYTPRGSRTDEPPTTCDTIKRRNYSFNETFAAVSTS